MYLRTTVAAKISSTYLQTIYTGNQNYFYDRRLEQRMDSYITSQNFSHNGDFKRGAKQEWSIYWPFPIFPCNRHTILLTGFELQTSSCTRQVLCHCPAKARIQPGENYISSKLSSLDVTNIMGADIAQLNHLRLPSYSPRFNPKAQNLHFLKIIFEL